MCNMKIIEIKLGFYNTTFDIIIYFTGLCKTDDDY